MPPRAGADFSFVHFTDTHIMAGGTFRGLDTALTLRRVVEVILALEPTPAFAVVGGDLVSPDLIDRTRVLASEEYDGSYRLLREIVRVLPYPVHFILGNHDDRAAFHRVMETAAPSPDARHHWVFEHAGHRFVGLDSHVPGQAWGEVDAGQLAWLEGDLRAHAGEPTVVFVHHHPWPLGLAWMDSMPLRNGDDLVGILERHPATRWIVCGHVHMDQQVQRDGLTMLTTPSTCFQVSKLSQTRKVLPGPPGFRLIQVRGGALSTRVIHLHGDAGAADL